MLAIDNSSLIGAFRSPRRLQFQPLSHLGAKTRAEVGILDPHAMQDASELAGDGNDRAHHVRSLGDPKTPGPRRRPRLHAHEKTRGRLAKRFAAADATLFANAHFIVDRSAGLMSLGRQAKMRANGS